MWGWRQTTDVTLVVKSKTTFLASRFGRRVFALFFVAALIPVGLSALVSYTQVGKALGKQSIEEMRDDARSYGMLLIEKLSLADAILGGLADQNGKESLGFAMNSELRQWFVSVSPVAGGEVQDRLPRDTYHNSALLEDIEPDRSAVFLAMNRQGTGRVFLVRASGHKRAGAEYIIAELNPKYLWGDASSFPELIDFCVVSDAGPVLNCSQPVPANFLNQLGQLPQQSAMHTLEWQANGDAFVGLGWHLFVNSRFTGDNWIVLAFQPQRAAFAALAGFNSLYLKVALLALVMVAFLSSVQIRRSLSPLQSLLAGTRRIALRDFSSPIKVKSGDEFEDLADSMNNMSERLRSQFHALGALSRVDRMILSCNGFAPVIDAILQDIREVVPCDSVMAGIIDRDADDFIQLIVPAVSSSGKAAPGRVDFAASEKQYLREIENHGVATVSELRIKAVCPLFEGGAVKVCIFPIMRGNDAAGFIALGYGDTDLPDKSQLQPAVDFADRIAVAIAAAEHEEQLHKQANYDELTGLPNRQLFFDRLSQELSYARRDNRLSALMFIDLDNFKRLNDSLGHSAGDELLRVASERLKKCVRDADTVARLGGDEFTVIISGIPSVTTASSIADLILDQFSRPFLIGKLEHLVTASIGITLFPDDGMGAEKLLKNADTAMYRAKADGRARKAFYEDSMYQAAMRRLEIEAELRAAVEAGNEFLLQFQPQVNLATGKLSGAEALVRWQSPVRGLVPPDEFISVAEDCGAIHDLGLWVLRQAAEQFMSWKKAGFEPVKICVNASTRQFERDTFASHVRTILLESGLHPHELELEITESLLIDNRASTMKNMSELQRMGIRIAIDDFGTGYSSLSYLRKFQFDTLKIDRAFVNGLPESRELSGITNAIVQMAHALGKNVVAEGIERLQELAYLKAIGCDEVQGYYLARPLDADAFEDFMHALHAAPVSIEKAG